MTTGHAGLPPVEELQQKGQQLNADLESTLQQLCQYNREELTPEHLRFVLTNTQVAVNALSQLLIQKGVFSEQEWMAALCQSMEQELQTYQEILSETTG